MAWELTPTEYELTRAKIGKINERAEKRGFTGRLGLVAEPFEKTTKTRVGFQVTERMYRVSVTGEPPRYNGWTLLAALDWTAEGPIVRTAPGVKSVDRSRLVQGKCDHCRKTRHRKSEYVVGDGAREFQVGSTCLKDFLGWSANVVTLWEEDLDKPLSGCWGGGPRSYSTETVLAVAWAVVTTQGYVRSREPGSTRDAVATFLSPGTSRHDKQFVEELRPVVEKAAAMGKALREWVLSPEFSGDSEYVANLKTLCRGDVMGWDHLGMLVSAPQAMAKAQEQTLIRQRERTPMVHDWYSQPKQRVNFRARVAAVKFPSTKWGVQTLYTLVTDDGYTLTWFASESVLGEQPSDEYRDLRATVAKHGTFRGRKQTIINRCAVVDTATAVAS